MQDVDENMDELFRKAAEHYMLNQGESNWTKISGRLQSSVAPAMPAGKKHAIRKYILTGILLLICFTAGMIVHRYTSKEDTPIAVNTKHPNNDAVDHKLNENSLPLIDKKLQQGKTASDVHTKINNTNIIPVKTSKALIKSYSLHNPDSARKSAIAFTVADLSLLPVTKDKTAYTLTQVHDRQTALQMQPVAIGQRGTIKDGAAKTSLIKINSKSKRGMYYGMLAGAGFTTVKSQSFTRPGFDAGFVAGYQSTSRSSVEINLIFSRKYYYSDGQYFNMDKMHDMPADMELMSLRGSSSIFEIPVKFKYNIIQKKSNTIYVAAGVSSYILVNEKNDYVTSTNGTMGKMNGNYTTTTGYFAGALNVNAGYEHTIGKNSTIRFEPYMTIPTKGIGIGNLPVTTSGVHILFTLASRK